MSGGPAIVTIDLGTQSLRVGVRTAAGDMLFSWQRPVATRTKGIIQEQYPAQWQVLLEEGLRAAAKAVPAPAAIVACGPLAGFVPLDQNGAAIGPAVMYNDARALDDLSAVESLATNPPGLPRPVVADPIPQALRLRREAPEIFARTRSLLDATAFLNYQLTGRTTLNAVSAIRLYGKTENLGIASTLFGDVVPTGETIGALQDSLCQSLGWPPIPVISAPFDSKVAYIASGIASPGEALDISGTVTSFGVVSAKPVIDPQRRIYSLPLGSAHLVRGSTAAAGSIVEWARELLGVSHADLAALAEESAPGAEGAVLVPYHSGARAPLWQPALRGAIHGLGLGTGRAALARSVFEGLAFSLRHIVETIESCGARVDTVRLAGGLAKSATLSQIKADILGRPLVVLEDTELTSLGLAIIGAVAVGAYRDTAAGSRALVREGRRFLPAPRSVGLEAAWAQYLETADCLDKRRSPEQAARRA